MQIPEKGAWGYTDGHKKTQLLKTFVYFLLPAAIFIAGYVTTGGKKNYFTVVALVGALPACKELVNVIMFWKRRSLPLDLYRELEAHAGGLTRLYELVLTTYDKSFPLPSLVIRGNEIAAYTTVRNTDLKPAEDHIITVLKQNGLGGIHVHIFTDLKAYLDRMDALERRETAEIPYTPDERYPGLTREELIRKLILAISL